MLPTPALLNSGDGWFASPSLDGIENVSTTDIYRCPLRHCQFAAFCIKLEIIFVYKHAEPAFINGICRTVPVICLAVAASNDTQGVGLDEASKMIFRKNMQ